MNVPTDNLYKFVAISGLALIITAITVPGIRLRDQIMKSFDLRSQVDALEIESATLEEKTRELEQELEAARRRPDRSGEHQLRNKQELLADLRVKLRIKTAEARGKLELLQFIARENRAILLVSLAIGSLGLIFSGSGFVLWYRRVQVYQDRLLKKEHRG